MIFMYFVFCEMFIVNWEVFVLEMKVISFGEEIYGVGGMMVGIEKDDGGGEEKEIRRDR